jgi:cytochrome c oxidase subunit I+III
MCCRFRDRAGGRFLGAVFTAVFFFMLTLKWMLPAYVTGVAAAGCIILWMWDTEPPPKSRVDIGGGLVLPTHMTGPQSHSWWAMVILMLVCGTSFACLVFSYLFLWTTRQEFFTAANLTLPVLGWPLASVLLYVLSAAMLAIARRRLARISPGDGNGGGMRAAIALAALIAAGCIDLYAFTMFGPSPAGSSHGAMISAIVRFQSLFVAIVAVMAGFTLAKSWAGLLDSVRRATFDNTMLLWRYTVVQGTIALAILYLFPRLTAVAP